jgi:hypothetical protein
MCPPSLSPPPKLEGDNDGVPLSHVKIKVGAGRRGWAHRDTQPDETDPNITCIYLMYIIGIYIVHMKGK